jgi:hypothetical protein
MSTCGIASQNLDSVYEEVADREPGALQIASEQSDMWKSFFIQGNFPKPVDNRLLYVRESEAQNYIPANPEEVHPKSKAVIKTSASVYIMCAILHYSDTRYLNG